MSFAFNVLSFSINFLQTLDNRSKMVVVRGFEAGTENDVIIHMEHFGELVDMDFGVPAQDKSLTAYFTYKKRRDAEQVFDENLSFFLKKGLTGVN